MGSSYQITSFKVNLQSPKVMSATCVCLNVPLQSYWILKHFKLEKHCFILLYSKYNKNMLLTGNTENEPEHIHHTVQYVNGLQAKR